MAKESMKAREVKRERLVAKYADKRAALKAEPSRPARTEWRETDETISLVWARLDVAGRRRWLADRGFRIRMWPGADVRVTREGNWPLRLTGQPHISAQPR